MTEGQERERLVRPDRPNRSNNGRVIRLVANHFRIDLPGADLAGAISNGNGSGSGSGENGKRKGSPSSEESDVKKQRGEAGAVAAAAPPRENVYLHHVTIMRQGADCNSMPLGGDAKVEQAVENKPSGAEPPKSLPKEINFTVIREFTKSNGIDVWAYDGDHQLYTLDEHIELLHPNDASTTIALTVAGEPFSIKVSRYPTKVNVRADILAYVKGQQTQLPAAALATVDVILKHNSGLNPRWVSVGRSFLDSTRRSSIGMGWEVWLGHSAVASVTEQGLSIVVDRSATSFVEGGPAVDIFKRQLGQDRRAADKLFKGCKVDTTHIKGQRRSFRIDGVSSRSAGELKFQCAQMDNKEVSVPEYFEFMYQVKCDPSLPCLISKRKNRDIQLPMEVCVVAKGYKKLTPSEGSGRITAATLQKAQMRPAERLEEIKKIAGEGHFGHLEDQFGLGSVAAQPTVLSGRVLPQPMVEVGHQSTVGPMHGSWNMKHVKSAYIPSRGLEKPWAVASFAGRDGNVHRFVDMMVDVLGRTFGMPRNATQPLFVHEGRDVPEWRDSNSSPQQIERYMTSVANDVDFLLCIIPPDADDCYRCIKFLGDSVLGIPTQCVVSKNIRDGGGGGGRGGGRGINMMYVTNVALKMHTKLGGTNFIVSKSNANGPASIARLPCVSEAPTLVIGVDVSHGNADQPSIAAAAGNIDAMCARYATVCKHMPPRTELIPNLLWLEDLFVAFLRNTSKKPERVIYFRDGVSEGQKDQLLTVEIPGLLDLFAKLNEGYRPKVTVIVTTKRHKTRLFCAEQRDADRSGNIPSGTVVDTTIVDPRHFDFYMASHGGLKGTSRPVHYDVICDENNFGMEAIESLCFRLCFQDARSTKAVSQIPLIRAADMVAEREKYRMAGKMLVGSNHDTGSHKQLQTSAKAMYFV